MDQPGPVVNPARVSCTGKMIYSVIDNVRIDYTDDGVTQTGVMEKVIPRGYV